MIKVLHLVESLSFGGAVRGAIATAKYSAQQGAYQHTFLSLAPGKSGLDIKTFAEGQGMRVVLPTDVQTIWQEIEAADIVQLQWWNSPEVDALLRNSLPPMRLAGWFHVGGHVAPQLITPTFLEYLDFAIPSSPHTLNAPAIQALSEQDRAEKVALVYDAADFARLEGIRPQAHETFNVGYIGTVHFSKMNPDYVAMSSAIEIPNVRFVVCGTGGAEEILREQAKICGMAERFDVRGYVQDILPIIQTFDVYGYPLCEDTYASAELNIQEVMFAGIPPVVFPYGGVRHLVVNDYTGYLVNSAREYKQAIEYLYHNPAERIRLGENAKNYARQIFGAENAARKLNLVYEQMLKRPKRTRSWSGGIVLGSPDTGNMPTGAGFFVESLGDQGKDFQTSLCSGDLDEIFAAEEQIMRVTELMFSGGIKAYRSYYTKDPFLWFWMGLAELGRGDVIKASQTFLQAANLGFGHWRVLWYLAQAMLKANERTAAYQLALVIQESAPEFKPAAQLAAELAGL